MRHTDTVNNGWLYTPRFRDIFTDPTYRPDDTWQRVMLPHANIELPYNCFDEGDFQFVSTYRNILPVPPAAGGSRVFLDFDGVMTEARVWINGQPAGVHCGGYTPFSIDVTPFALPGEKALVTVRVDSRELDDIPPFGNVIDYLTYGGIYRDVALRIVPPVYLDSVFARPGDILEDKKTLTADIQCRNALEEAVDGDITLTLLDNGGSIMAEKRYPCSLSPGFSVHEIMLGNLENILLWAPSHPNLYTLSTVLTTGGDGESDRLSVRCGFRTARFTDKGFFLNGTHMNLRGLNRHQSYPYVGYAMPAREQRRDADRLRFDLGVNLVRTSHYPQSPHFLDRCDEIGLLVFEEIPGWQHLGLQYPPGVRKR